jgi:hypothetical protein
MIAQMILEKPEDPVSFMLNWLKKVKEEAGTNALGIK